MRTDGHDPLFEVLGCRHRVSMTKKGAYLAWAVTVVWEVAMISPSFLCDLSKKFLGFILA